MAISARWFTNGPKAIAGDVSWSGSNVIKVLLLTDTYSPNQDSHDFYDDITAISNAEVANGNGYTTGGKVMSLGSRVINVDTGTNETRLDGEDMIWTSSTITAKYAIVYMDSGTAATSPLLGYADFGQNVASSNGNFTITWDSTGILKLTATAA